MAGPPTRALRQPWLPQLQGGPRPHRNMPELPGSATVAPVDLAVQHDGKADATTDRQDEEVRDVLATAIEQSGDAESVDVVLDQDGDAQRPRSRPPSGNRFQPSTGESTTPDWDCQPRQARRRRRRAGWQRGRRAPAHGAAGQHVKTARSLCVERILAHVEHLAVHVDIDRDNVVGGHLHSNGTPGRSDQPQQLRGTPAAEGRWATSSTSRCSSSRLVTWVMVAGLTSSSRGYRRGSSGRPSRAARELPYAGGPSGSVRADPARSYLFPAD